MTHSTNSLRELRQRRERADDWIVYASWTAIGIATLGCLIAVMGLLDTDEIEPLGAIVLIYWAVQKGDASPNQYGPPAVTEPTPALPPGAV